MSLGDPGCDVFFSLILPQQSSVVRSTDAHMYLRQGSTLALAYAQVCILYPCLKMIHRIDDNMVHKVPS